MAAENTEKSKKRKYHCVDIWAIPESILALNPVERDKALPSYFRSSDGPFAPNSLNHQAPITFWEEALVMLLLFVPMGMSLICIWTSLGIFVWGTNFARLLTVGVLLVLMYHPVSALDMARLDSFSSHCMKIIFQYFTYRFVWVDDNYEVAKASAPWIGASPPHGVLPFANVLSMGAINVAGIEFEGAPASAVFRTPFLRYFTLLPCIPVDGKSISASVSRGTSVGIVPDGIAGIFRQSQHKEVVALKTRRGLARHCLRHGTNIVPAYSFGNTQVFGAWWDPFGIMEWCSRKAKVSIFFYWGRLFLPIPRRAQITMTIGKPIIVEKVANPTVEQIEALHDQLLQGIQDAFELHKHALGWGDKDLVFE